MEDLRTEDALSPRYLEPSASLTLREAIADHLATLPAPLGEGDSDPELSELMEGHDACHALFGCDTSITNEAMVDTWTLAGTDMTLKRYATYLNNPAITGLVQEIGYAAAFCTTVAFLPQAIQVWRTRSTDDLSLGMLLLFDTGLAFWLLPWWPLRLAAAALLALAETLLLIATSRPPKVASREVTDDQNRVPSRLRISTR